MDALLWSPSIPSAPRASPYACLRRSPPLLRRLGEWSRRSQMVPAGAGPRRGGSARPEPELSVLRFTLGIPGLDEAYLPRYIGAALGSLLLLNHFVGANGDADGAQLRTEVVGLSLAAFSIVLPYLGRFLKGATQADRSILPEGNTQIFLMTNNISDSLKEDFAWSTFVLLRNTTTMSVLLAVQGMLCVRGYWNVTENASKNDMLDWFKTEIQQMGLFNLDETLYFPQIDGELWNILPNGAASVLIEPLLEDPDKCTYDKMGDFLMLVSASNYAYTEKDRAWVKAIANKFQSLKALETCL